MRIKNLFVDHTNAAIVDGFDETTRSPKIISLLV